MFAAGEFFWFVAWVPMMEGEEMHALQIIPGKCVEVDVPGGAAGAGLPMPELSAGHRPFCQAFFERHCMSTYERGVRMCNLEQGFDVTNRDAGMCVLSVLLTAHQCARCFCDYIWCPFWCPCNLERDPHWGPSTAGSCAESGYAEHDGWMGTSEVKSEKKSLAKYLDGVFGTADTPAKYPGLVFQKLIPDFGNGAKCPELRLYYVGGKYQYSMCSAGGRYLRPREEGGKTDFPLDVLKPHTADIMTKLPKMIMQGKELPRLLDRFDMGYMIDGKPVTPYVNEIEFVPSLYIEDHPFVVEKELGDQMVNIALTLKGSSLDEMASYLEI